MSSISTTVLTPDVFSPLVVDCAESIDWHDAADVVVVGFGAAGAAAALETKEQAQDADVLVIDRFEGGGASAISGGVVYAGGTRYQSEAGFQDTADEMFKYLSLEVGDAVRPETLRRFCDTSNENMKWLEKHGVRFASSLHEGKTSYPPNGKFLYFSGNEKVEKYKAHARPAPRGHRTLGHNWTGRFLFAALRQAIERSGVRLMLHAPARRLVVDKVGNVLGVEIALVPEAQQATHQSLYRKVNPMVPMQNRRAEKAIANAQLLENTIRDRKLIRARSGVVLSTGGFIYNSPMLKQYAAPNCADNYLALVRTGTMGCSGAGIRLGLSVGAAVRKMHNVMVGRSISPPAALLEGVIVNQAGRRMINEDTYAGFLGDAICAQPEGRAWLILDRLTLRRVLWQTLPSGDSTFYILKLPTLINVLFGGTRRAPSIEALAEKCGVNPDGLRDEIARYNSSVRNGSGDPMGKNDAYAVPIEKPPFYAVNMAMSNPLAPTLSLTLGGLVVNEATGEVLRIDGGAITGLYAAGRAAVGVCSNGYFSGMSLADCIFSGRRAGSALGSKLSRSFEAKG